MYTHHISCYLQVSLRHRRRVSERPRNRTSQILTRSKVPSVRLMLCSLIKVRTQNDRRSLQTPSQKHHLHLLLSLPHVYLRINVLNKQRPHKSHNRHLRLFPVRVCLRPNPSRSPSLHLHRHPHHLPLLPVHLPLLVPLSHLSIPTSSIKW